MFGRYLATDSTQNLVGDKKKIEKRKERKQRTGSKDERTRKTVARQIEHHINI